MLFKKRNLERNVLVDINGIHNLYPSHLHKFGFIFVRQFLYIKEYLRFYILKKLSIPQFEFILTTRCTLKCKKCAGYFSSLRNDEHFELSFENYKTQLDNLLNSVDEIKNLILTGGEPLMSKDFIKICEYTLKMKKIKKVWIFTNGTLMFPNDLLEIIQKYNKKIVFKLANYSNRNELKHLLKTMELIQCLEKLNCRYIYKQENWIDVTEIKDHNRSEIENIKYYRQCIHNCVASVNGMIFACPRGGVITNLKKLSRGTNVVNLNEKISKANIIDFYSKDYFEYCNFCNFNSEKNMPFIMPAEQM